MILEVIGYIITVSLATIIPPFTVVPLELVAPSRYGLFLAFVYTLLGNILGASVPFLLARRYGWGLMEKLFKEKEVEKAKEIAKNYSFWKITWIRMIFTPLFDVLSYACGLTRISTGKFIVSTIISNVPTITVILIFGNNINLSFTFIVWLSAGILLVSLIFLTRRLRRKSLLKT